MHIAILKPKYYNMILNGQKTIESRFSMHKIPPYNKLEIGQQLYLKQTGKDVTATAIIAKVEYFELTKEKTDEIKAKYSKSIGLTNPAEWQKLSNKKYCTLIWLKNVKKITPIKVPRSNGAGWIILDEK